MPISIRKKSSFLLLMSMLAFEGLVFAYTIYIRAPIQSVRWTWIEGRTRFNVGAYPTIPTAQLLVYKPEQKDGPFLVQSAFRKGVISPFTVNGEIFPYYLTAEVSIINLTGVTKDNITLLKGKTMVKYTEYEWLFDDKLEGTVEGTVEVSVDGNTVTRAFIKFGSTVLGFHELEFGGQLALAGIEIPRMSKPVSTTTPVPSPTGTPAKRIPLTEYMKTLIK